MKLNADHLLSRECRLRHADRILHANQVEASQPVSDLELDVVFQGHDISTPLLKADLRPTILIPLDSTIQRQVDLQSQIGVAVVEVKIKGVVLIGPNLMRSRDIDDRTQVVGGVFDLPPIVSQVTALIHQIQPLYKGGNHRIVLPNVDGRQARCGVGQQ